MADLEITPGKNQNNSNPPNNNGGNPEDSGKDPGGLSITQMQSDKKVSGSSQTGQPGQSQVDIDSATKAAVQSEEEKQKAAQVSAEDITGELQEKGRARRGQKFSESISKILESKQGKTYSTAILSILLVAVMFFFAITPAVSSITRQLEINSDLRERINSMTTKQQNLNTLLSKSRDNAQAIEQFNSIMGEDKNESEDYEEIMNMLDSNNMELRTINFSQQSGQISEYDELRLSDKLQVNNIRLVVLGSISGASGLTRDLEESKRLFDIEEITISEPEDISDTNDYQVEYNLRTFYWQQFDE